MHEDQANSTVLDSRLINNNGNSYISIYKTASISGLLVKGNDIRTDGGITAIYVVANSNGGPYECKMLPSLMIPPAAAASRLLAAQQKTTS